MSLASAIEKNVYMKLVEVQSKLKAPKSQFNKFGNYAYRNCEDILEALKPLLNEVKAIINITNDIVKSRIENIANVVNRVLAVNSEFEDIPIYLTGDGVCNFRGITNLFEAVCERKVHILKSPLHNGEDKYQTSKISLVKIMEDLI